MHEIEVVAPYRLDLTVSALRRLSTNIVDVFTADGEYIRAQPGARETVVARVRQSGADTLLARFEGGGALDRQRALVVLRRVLGVDRDVSGFHRAARRLPWLSSLAARMRGVKPPRYPTLWEACVNAVLFQQVSLAAASSISRRLTLALGAPVTSVVDVVHPFPSLDRFRSAHDDVVRSAGVSASKLATLRRVSEALHDGTLDEEALERLPSSRAAALLCAIKGIGPWTATVILLRGLGRLDVFPMHDSSVVRNLALVAGNVPVELEETLATLGTQRGMLYYCLLLARLEARDELGLRSRYSRSTTALL